MCLEKAPSKFVALFVDWKPAENLEPSDRERLCMVGLIGSNQSGMPKLASYKKTRGKNRKLKRAAQLIDYLDAEKIELDVIAVSGISNGSYVQWACDSINRVRPKIGAEWVLENGSPVALSWNNNIYPRSNVLGISLYAGLLPILALRAKMRLEAVQQREKHVKLCLDRLPLDANAGIRLLNAFHQDDDIGEMWRDNCSGGYSFQTGIFDSYIDPTDGRSKEGKDHPLAILVDWMAQACMAKIAPEPFREENNFDENETSQIAAIWDTVDNQQRGYAQIIDVDDPEYIKRATEHMRTREAPSK